MRSTVSLHVLGSENTRPVLASGLREFHPDFSPDGQRLAFCSSRSGESVEIWLASADGSNAQQLTRGPGVQQQFPAWSPKGDRLAFNSNADGVMNIWVINVDGGAPRRLTDEPGQHTRPTWSRSGEWVYFSSARPEGRAIWRVPSHGGRAERVTSTGGAFGVESFDRTELIYKVNDAESALRAQPLNGGPSREVVPCVNSLYFAVGSAGIYYAACGTGPERALHLLDPRTGQTRVLGTLRDVFRMTDRLAVSPDGKTILVHKDSYSADLMLLENFK
jgi:Tol biopolymer transport system component